MRRTLGLICVGFACFAGCAASQPAEAPGGRAAGQGAILTERPAAAAAAASAGDASPDPSTPGERAIAASAAPATSDVIALVGGLAITKDELLAPMLQEHGLNFLLHLVQLDLARQAAARQNLTVTPEDVKAERDLTFKNMLAESQAELRQKMEQARADGDFATAEKLKAQLEIDPEAALDAYLAQRYAVTRQYFSKGEFNLVLETNAHLRKIARASPDLEKLLTDETVRKAWGAQMGEKVVIRHIQANNLEGITEARRRLQAGENFAEVAKAVSTNVNTAPNGGAVRPFTMNDPDVPELFKKAAFDMNLGEVSDVLQADNAFHILKLENRIEPKVVKFEDAKEEFRAGMYDQLLQAAVKQLRDKVARQAQANLRIQHPVLKQQYEQRLNEQRVASQQQLDQQLKRDRAVTAPPGEGEPEAPAPAEAGDDGQPAEGADAEAPQAPATSEQPKATRPKAAGPAGAAAPAPRASVGAAKPKATKPARPASPAAPAR